MKYSLPKYFVALLVSLTLAACYKNQFFPDVDDPGLSRFTSRGYNVLSAYINGQPWVNYFSRTHGPAHVRINLATLPAASDTLYIQWLGGFSNELPSPNYNQFLSFAIPVKKGFSLRDFMAWNGTLLPADSTTVTVSLLNSALGSPFDTISGKGHIYFVKISPPPPNLNDVVCNISGLFDGNIGDSVMITKGRFDYEVFSGDHNLP